MKASRTFQLLSVKLPILERDVYIYLNTNILLNINNFHLQYFL